MSDQLIISAIGLAGIIAAYLFGKRKSKADAQQTEVNTANVVVKMWRELAEEFKGQVETLKIEVAKLTLQVSTLEEKILHLERP